MPTMTSCTATHAAMRCPTGSPTSRSGSRRSAPPRRRWKRTPKLPPPKRRGIGPRSRTSASAHTLTSSMSDHGQLVPLLNGIQANLGRRPREASADSGYLSEANLASLEARVIKAYIATGRAKHPADVKRKIGGPLTQGMRRKLKRAGWRSRYRLRKQIVEPVFGQIKQARGFRQFLLRGIDAVAAEWAMICTPHTLTKLARAT